MEMETEAGPQGFDDLLNAVLLGNKAIDCILDHPEFQSRALRICRRIACCEEVDDLFDEACSRILIHESTDKDHLRTSDRFLRWFYRVARQINAEDKELEAKLKSIVCLARGFDQQGRLLTGVELQAAHLEHEQRMKVWNDAVLKKDFPFRQLSLCNGTKEIARCGIFFDFAIHESLHELDLKSGLQIRGIGRTNVDDDVLLGFYPLEGFQHDGEEKPLVLDNGYTVGLRVRKSKGNKYWIKFRCVESQVFDAELEDVGSDIDIDCNSVPTDDVIDGDGSPAFTVPAHAISNVAGPPPPPPVNYGWRTVALSAMLLLVVGLAYGVRLDNAAENQREQNELLSKKLEDYISTVSKETSRNQDAAFKASTRESDNQQQQIKFLKALNKERARNELLLNKARKTLSQALILWRVVYQHEAGLSVESAKVRVEHEHPYVVKPEVIGYQLDAQKGYRVSDDPAAIFYGSNELVRFNYPAAVPVQPGAQPSAFKVVWDVKKEMGKIVEVQATVYHGDQHYRDFVFSKAPTTEGCLDSVCRKSLKSLADAIATVYEFINPDWNDQPNSSPPVPLPPESIGRQEPPVTPCAEENIKPTKDKSIRGKGHEAE